MTSVDLTNIANAFLALAAAAVTAAIPILVPYILKRLHIANDADLSAKLATAADAAAGAAYNYASQHEGGLARLDVKNAAIASGVNYVNAAMPAVVAQLGVTPARVEAMVTARLGTLLAGDPSVTAGTPPKVPVGPVAVPVPVAVVGDVPAAVVPVPPVPGAPA